MKTSAIHPNPANPRAIKDANFEKLCKSITDFPKMMELRPIVIDAAGMILGGNMRFKAIQHLGMKEIPDTWVRSADSLTPDEQRRFIIADNVSGGDWDVEDLAANWDKEELNEWGVDVEWPVDGGNPFDDEGITAQNKYGVIVELNDAAEQEAAFNDLARQGYKCKILVV